VVSIQNQLVEYLEMIQDTDLKKTVKEFLNNPPTDLNANCLPLEMCPAGAYHHHNYEGGLVQHTISVIKISLTLCHLIEDNYGGQVNRDMVLAGSILHDIMKCYCYEKNPEGNFRTSEFGEKIDHLSLMVSELMKRDFSTDIIHIIASHHGEIRRHCGGGAGGIFPYGRAGRFREGVRSRVCSERHSQGGGD